MTDTPAPPNIPLSTSPIGNTFDADTLAPRELRVVLVCDVVESVRWMEQDEDDAVSRWQALTHHVRHSIVPAHSASVVKSTGDGMMIEFASARSAVQASAAMHSAAALANAGLPHERHMLLRTGIHETHARRDAFDLYGHGVNLAARITTLAGPGETIVSAPVRDHLTDTLDGDIEDMGECYLKHIAQPQRVYRVGTASAEPILVPVREYAEPLQPTIAVIPFTGRNADSTQQSLGDIVAEELIIRISKSAQLRVTSRLSTASVKNRDLDAKAIGRLLSASFILSGSFLILGEKIRLALELAEASTNLVIWSDTFADSVSAAWSEDSQMLNAIISDVCSAISHTEIQRTQRQPLPTLQSYSLLIGSIGLMHRTSSHDLLRSKQILEHLTERNKKLASPHAWLANWFALRVTQSQTKEPQKDIGHALTYASKALECDPCCSLALSIDGVLQANLAKNMAVAIKRFEMAIDANPNEPLAWLFKGIVHGFLGEGVLAKIASDKALTLSPLDPIKHYYDSLAATACLGAQNYVRSIELAERSLRANRMHASTYRTLAVAQMLSGNESGARQTIRELQLILPSYTISDFKKNSGFSAGPLQAQFAQALKDAGLKS